MFDILCVFMYKFAFAIKNIFSSVYILKIALNKTHNLRFKVIRIGKNQKYFN